MSKQYSGFLIGAAVLACGSAASGDLVRFATYNTYNLGYNGVITGGKCDAMEAVMSTIDADVWAVQEIRDAGAFNEFISQRFDGLYETVVAHGNSVYQVGVISKYPIVEVIDHANDRDAEGNKIFSRTALEVTIRFGEQLVTVISTHLQPGYDRPFRNKEGQRLAQIIEALPPDRPVVVMGDFNDVFSASYETVPSPVNLVQEAGATAVPARNPVSHSLSTYSSTTPVIRYDYVFLSQDLYERLTAHEVHQSGSTKAASDHLPVWAEVDIEIVPEPASVALWSAASVGLWLLRRRRGA